MGRAAIVMSNPASRPLLISDDIAESPGHDAYLASHHQPTTVRRPRATLRFVLSVLRPYFGSLAIALAGLAIAVPISLLLDVSSLSRVFLVAVLVSAVAYGLWPSMFAACISVIIYDFFFIPPVYSLEISSTEDKVNLAFFMVTAIVVSILTARVRRYAVLADQRALTAENLSAFSRRIGGALTVDAVLARASEDIAAAMGTAVVTILAEGTQLNRVSVHASGTTADAELLDQLERAWAASATRPATMRLGAWRFLGLTCDEATACLIGVRQGWSSAAAGGDSRPLLQAFAQQTASAIAQNRLRQRLHDASVRIDAEAFGAALLNSISHDLRGKLTAILGATSALDLHWKVLQDDSRLELVRTAREESEHLSAYIGNLLDVSRLQSGTIGPILVPLDLADLVASASGTARAALSAHRLAVDVPDTLPLVQADATLLQQTLVNLLDNAAKYAPHGSLIGIQAAADTATVMLRILDEGPGLPDGELDRVFDKFFRSATTSTRQPGTGLGLTICRGLVEAMHGTVRASNRTDRSGLCVSITLPAAPADELSPLADLPRLSAISGRPLSQVQANPGQ
jgi:two-component system sensor histidine kinase KdpD